MSRNGHTNGNLDPGGQGDSIDVSRRQDRAYVRQAISRGWGLTPEKLKRYAEALDRALQLAEADGSAREIRGCVTTLAKMVDQVQSDEQLDAKASGDIVEHQEIIVRYVDAPPMPRFSDA